MSKVDSGLLSGGMDGIDLRKLAKVLALADSARTGEANTALRAAGRLLGSGGKIWGDLAQLVLASGTPVQGAGSAPEGARRLEASPRGGARPARPRAAAPAGGVRGGPGGRRIDHRAPLHTHSPERKGDDQSPPATLCRYLRRR